MQGMSASSNFIMISISKAQNKADYYFSYISISDKAVYAP